MKLKKIAEKSVVIPVINVRKELMTSFILKYDLLAL